LVFSSCLPVFLFHLGHYLILLYQQPVTMQFPVQVPIPPLTHDSVQGVGALVQSTVQVEPLSHTTSQPPPAQLMLHEDELSQSVVHLPPGQP